MDRRNWHIGSLREAGRRLAIWCGACNTMSYLTADETMLMPKVELPAMEKFYPCPACGHSTGEGAKQLFRIRIDGMARAFFQGP